ncbi:MAG: glutamine--fructose-6-phosphate transaminase (isomerizing) [Bacteroidetes bacterium]|jgi:glucosamine--fructose-6-phosphate aminotransferase (isomerizing)|nr:glutamine--fructose-6-phosphate transaminase (isomerizing) [Bacteroidota bacterium]
MCGIVAYTGDNQAFDFLIKGLQRLEYRGYDSAGIALLNGQLNVYKQKGKVQDLLEEAKGKDISGTTGMGHTRWATHGEPNQVNAHPHVSQSGNIAVIHNGIIENFATLKEALVKNGHTFKSDTDTEVLIHLIEDIQVHEKVKLFEAVRLALNEVVGAYAIVIISKDDPGTIIGARKGSPLVIGVGKDKKEYFMASDATPIVEYTRDVIYLDENEIAEIKDNELTIKTIDNVVKTPYIQKLEVTLDAIEKGGYEHFMLKEIYEQPKSIYDSMRGRFHQNDLTFAMRSLREYESKIKNLKRIIIVGCGTSWHAGLVAEYIIEEFARLPVEVEYASEFRYRDPIITEDDLVIAISQSGETADTLAALELAKEKGATIYGICNVVGSSIPRLTHAGAYTHAGPEIGVASTKAFTAQVTLLTLIALGIADIRGKIKQDRLRQIFAELEALPGKVEQVLKSCEDKVKEVANRYKDVDHFLYLGRGVNFPVALEGALKLKEISYIHAEGYPAAEMKHGPIALIDENMPVVVIAPNRGYYEKVFSNIQEVKARKGNIISIVTEGDEKVLAISDYSIEIPDTEDCLVPILATIPLQLLSYHIALLRGCNVDQPRNLAKSVTVE